MDKKESVVQPMGRELARELTKEEIARVSGAAGTVRSNPVTITGDLTSGSGDVWLPA